MVEKKLESQIETSNYFGKWLLLYDSFWRLRQEQKQL